MNQSLLRNALFYFHQQGTIIMLLVAVGLTIIGFTLNTINSTRLRNNTDQVTHTYRVLNGTANFLSTVKDAETGQRGFIITGEEQYLEPYLKSKENSVALLQGLQTLTADNPVQQQRLSMIAQNLQGKLAELSQTIELKKRALTDSDLETELLEMIRSGVGKQFMDQMRKELVLIEQTENELLVQRKAALAATNQQNMVVQILISLFNITIIGIAIITIRRQRGARQQLFETLQTNTRQYLFHEGIGLATAPTHHLASTDHSQPASGKEPTANQPSARQPQTHQLDEQVVVDNLIDSLKEATRFIVAVGNGDYQVRYGGITEENHSLNATNLAGELVRMRDKMQLIAQEDKRRNWTNEGLAQFSQLLRRTDQSFAQLADQIIAHLVRYVGANQGGLFVVSGQNESGLADKSKISGGSEWNSDRYDNLYIELVAAYAYDRKKYLSKRVSIGEGLLGQVFLEKEYVYLTDIPQQYISITSGLGQASPHALLIVPLLAGEQVLGMVEMASFHSFEPYQIEFIIKLGEVIAATLASARANEHTSWLLEQSQQVAEELRAQEEEMRQNMEELVATQEEMHRRQAEAEQMESQIKLLLEEAQLKEISRQAIIDNTDDSTVAF